MCFFTVSNTDVLKTEFLSVILWNVLVLSHNSFSQSAVELCKYCMDEKVITSLKVDADGIQPLSPAGVAR